MSLQVINGSNEFLKAIGDMDTKRTVKITNTSWFERYEPMTGLTIKPNATIEFGLIGDIAFATLSNNIKQMNIGAGFEALKIDATVVNTGGSGDTTNNAEWSSPTWVTMNATVTDGMITYIGGNVGWDATGNGQNENGLQAVHVLNVGDEFVVGYRASDFAYFYLTSDAYARTNTFSRPMDRSTMLGSHQRYGVKQFTGGSGRRHEVITDIIEGQIYYLLVRRMELNLTYLALHDANGGVIWSNSYDNWADETTPTQIVVQALLKDGVDSPFSVAYRTKTTDMPFAIGQSPNNNSPEQATVLNGIYENNVLRYTGGTISSAQLGNAKGIVYQRLIGANETMGELSYTPLQLPDNTSCIIGLTPTVYTAQQFIDAYVSDSLGNGIFFNKNGNQKTVVIVDQALNYELSDAATDVADKAVNLYLKDNRIIIEEMNKMTGSTQRHQTAATSVPLMAVNIMFLGNDMPDDFAFNFEFKQGITPPDMQ